MTVWEFSPDIEVSMEYNPDIICTDDDIQLQAAYEFNLNVKIFVFS